MKFINPDWPAPKQIKAYTTTRQGWGERHASWDTARGFHTANAAEYQNLKNLINLPNEPIWMTQTHSTIAIEATPENKEQVADATFTADTNRVCAVLTADCLPILICHKQGNQVAAIHAGWRGLAGGIIENTVQAMQTPGSELLAWLGPAIGPSKFEVGHDVYTAFTDNHADAASAFTPLTEDKWLADLYALARFSLIRLGVSAIYGGHFCTYTQADLFYSYRRDQGKTGRMASLIWIEHSC